MRKILALTLKLMPCLAASCFLAAMSAAGAERNPPLNMPGPTGLANPDMRFGAAVAGNRAGLWSDPASNGLQHLPNVWGMLEVKGKSYFPPIAEYVPNQTGISIPDSFAVLAHPDGSVSLEMIGWPAEGNDGSWMGNIGSAFYAAIQGPGVYKVLLKIADLESVAVNFTVVPEPAGYIADPRLAFFEALRKARRAAEPAIRADAARKGYDPIFAGGAEQSEETWVTYVKRFKDGHRENPNHGVVACNKTTGAIRWVPVEQDAKLSAGPIEIKLKERSRQ